MGLRCLVGFVALLAPLVVANAGESTSHLTQTPGITTTDRAEGQSENSRAIQVEDGWMVAYEQTIPGTSVTFEMLPVPGGVVRLPVSAEDGEPAYCDVELPPYWVGRCEVTWAEYREFMKLNDAYAQLQQLANLRKSEAAPAALESSVSLTTVLDRELIEDIDAFEVDAVTAPTALYDPSTTYESGDEPDLPAVTMTPFAARQYTKWLSQLTGQTYRLPSEAEWLHAASAGEPIDFDAEGEADAIDGIAWHTDNADYVAHPVGEKAPNAWGLFDTLGNAAELVLDAFYPQGRPELANRRVGPYDAVAWPRDGDVRLAKGGWFDAEVETVTLADRIVSSDEDWKASDPNLPMSPWWYADYPATGVGFRLVRTLKPLPAELRSRVWDTADADVARAVNERLREGRGKLGPTGPELPKVLEELNRPAVRALLK